MSTANRCDECGELLDEHKSVRSSDGEGIFGICNQTPRKAKSLQDLKIGQVIASYNPNAEEEHLIGGRIESINVNAELDTGRSVGFTGHNAVYIIEEPPRPPVSVPVDKIERLRAATKVAQLQWRDSKGETLLSAARALLDAADDGS